MANPRTGLVSGTIIDCYSIIKLIGSGGFSLIYLAQDEDSLERVVIKEYLPRDLAHRGERQQIEISGQQAIDNFNRGKKLFFLEAKTLATLRHPNIVNVLTFFLANNTAYLVMDYEPGRNLSNYIKRHNGKLSSNFLLTVFPPVLDALNLIHSSGKLHLDIKPGNIHLRAGGNPLLLDFGAVHQFATSRRGQGTQVVTPGFSPVEQYYASGYVGPWSDVYAIGASMRACMEGHPPPSAIERHARDKMRPALSLFKKRYPSSLLEIVDWAMEVDPLLRPQDAGSMLQALLDGNGRPKPGGSESGGRKPG